MRFYNATKRGVDILVSSAVILLLLSWLIPIIGLIIKLDSKGPVFFVQSRDGKNKKPFYCLKFRTMKPSWTAHLIQAKDNDDRITKIGMFLRKSHIDELPQFINIFLADMTLIGPRPHMHRDTNYYGQLIENHDDRLLVTPGFTGLAQINDLCGNTGELMEMKHRVKLDRFYAANQSVLLDAYILYKSLVIALRKVKTFVTDTSVVETANKTKRRFFGKGHLKRVA